MSTATPVATVISVTGMAFARSADGAVRRLSAGDTILEGETVFTLAGGELELAFADGHHATILASESYLIGPEAMVATSPGTGEAAITAAGEVGKVIAALEQGGDILEGLQAPAAGGAANNDGNNFVRLLRIVEPVTPIEYEFPVNTSEQIRAPEGDVTPQEEQANGQPSAGASEATVDDDAIGGNPGGTGDWTDTNLDGDNNEATFSGVLPHDFGSDGPGEVNLSAMDGLTAAVGIETVTYSWNDASDTLTATITGGDRDGTPLFTVHVDPATGEYTVTLLDNVLHESLDGLPGDNTENDASVVLTYNVTDGNGDTATGSLTISFDDDIPTADITSGQGSVTVDESSGLQDNDTGNAAVAALFSSLTGVSTDMTQFAQSSASLVDASASSAGADQEGATTVLSLAVNGGDGTDSGLETTDGTQIFLYQENGLIVGRIGNEVGDGTDTANADGTIAFAIAINQDGTVSVAQYASITNPDAGDGTGGTYDETADLTGKINAVVTVTDGDGDTATDSVDIGDQIFFSDDGPTAVDETTQQIYEGFTTTTDALVGTVAVPASNGTSNFIYITTLNGLTGGDTMKASWTTNGSTNINWELRAADGVTVVASGTGSGTSLTTTLSGLLASGDYQLWIDATNKALTVTDVTFEHVVTSSLGGNVLANGDSFGADEEGGIVSAITYVDGTGTHTAVVDGDGTTVTTLYGALTIYQDGTYVYQANANAVPASDADGKVTDSFSYTIMDGDGDTATADMNFEVLDVPEEVPSAAYFTMNTSNTGGGGDTGFQQFQISITDGNVTALSQTIEVANEEGQQSFFVSMGGDVVFQPSTQYAITLEYISGSAHLNFTNFSITDKYGNTITLNGAGGSDNVTLTGDEGSSYDGVVYVVTVDGGGNTTVSKPIGYDINTAANGDDVLALSTPNGQLDFSLDMGHLPIGTDANDINLFGEIDRINISGSGTQEDNTLMLSGQDVLDLVDGDHTLWISGDAGDSLVLADAGSWTQGATNVAGPDGSTYTAYTATVNSTLVTLYVENDVTQPMP